MTVATPVVVDLGRGHTRPDCLAFAGQLQRQLSYGYTHAASMMPLPEYLIDWRNEHRTARKRADRARRLGYVFRQIRRRDYERDVFEINTSKDERQGRPMSTAYREPMTFGADVLICSEHHVYPYGVLFEEKLVAYLWLYRCGDLAMVSSILGHAAHLDSDVMYLLVEGMLEAQIGVGQGQVFYNLHGSGTDGLRYFKERIGLASTEVEWRV